MRRQFLWLLAERQAFTDLTILDFQDTKCGIHRSIQEPDMQWELMQVQR